ncbi:glycosyltransferase [Staphylococcus durrellii]|uniref:glycosyltransferase n=1 Tax=Staphylococcus durrellii TaxID=2781773 RepID=UPI00189CFDE8|nr:glycosyltransferase [Staphylococcus durrellii]MBF7015970.1 CDP-glycerol glycerophosphotransferase family protein [Staphylococcus durrellii]
MKEKLKKFILNQGKRKIKFLIEPLKLQLRSKYTRNIMYYANLYQKVNIDEDYILYQVRDGQSMTDSPYAIFKHLINDKSFKNFQHIWVVSNSSKQKSYSKLYNQYNNVKFIVKESKDYLFYLAKCKYLINNATFPNYFTKKHDQTYINTWHGTPLKFMGLDIKNNLVESQNTIRNFLSSDYIITPNNHTSEVFKKAFKLGGLIDNSILEIGYPRIDNTLNSNKDDVIKKLNNQGIKTNNSPILMFSPTWRGRLVSDPEDNIEDMIEIIEQLNKETKYQVILKVHPFIYHKAMHNKKLKPYLIDDDFDTNELLSVVDMLVTDYSSIFFDYLVTDKPIIFYTPDYETYEQGRGLYLPVNSLPGPSVHTVTELINTIINEDNILSAYRDKYIDYKENYTSLNIENVTAKLVNYIFDKKSSPIPKSQQAKKTLLIYPGGMKPNGITTSLMNLLESIDHNTYDVTLFLDKTTNKDTLDNLYSINSNVRVILRSGPLLSTTTEYYRNILVRNRGIMTKIEKLVYPDKLYEREFRKVFGNAEFDYAIDFSGYAMFWSSLVLASHAKRKLIYLHSDMKMDMERTVNGIRPHYANVKGTISMYPYFDKLVNVSEVTKQENINKLSKKSTRRKFQSSNNTINLPKIRKLMNDDNDIFVKNDKRVLVRQIDKQISSVPFSKEDYKVMTMGRLSPEKGFDNLIKSFEIVVKKHPSAKLYILGDGPLMNQLSNLIITLKLENNVFLMGQKRNPFFIMKECDLFVLPSYYEGQSMVLLEALTIGINVLASNIVANKYVLDYGKYGMLCDNDYASLATNIIEFINGENKEYDRFDAQKYNKAAINQFYDILLN